MAHSLNKNSPELVNKSQFKLLMNDVFKIRDSKLLDNVFMIADVDGEGALDIREICSTMLFHMRGTIEIKLALFFEIMKNQTVYELHDGGFILKQNLLKVIDDALKFFKQAFFQAKHVADQMNTKLDGQISYEEFENFCRMHPPAMDFLCRMTVTQRGANSYP